MPTNEKLYGTKDKSKVRTIGDSSIANWFKNLGGVGNYQDIEKGKTPKRGEK